MSHRLEITLKPHLPDAEGQGICRKAKDYLGIELEQVRIVHILTIDANLSPAQSEKIRSEIFTNLVTQISSFDPLSTEADWVIWIGYRPGVRDNAGSTAAEAVEDLLRIRFSDEEAIYTSKRYCLKGKGLTAKDADTIASELLANDIIQQWKIYSQDDWDPSVGIGMVIPKVILNHTPTLTAIPIDSDETLRRISDERNLALSPGDIPYIREYFLNQKVLESRQKMGLSDPTDIELEYISQARSDHCNHNTFQGLFRYQENPGEPVEIVNNLFKTCIEKPTIELQARKPWVVSVLWDNAGAGKLDEDYYYVITGETHNSPSNMEAYGGAITGIVGVYRDPLGTGKGSKLVMGGYGFCVGHRDYTGDLKPRLHPRRLLDGIIEGVRDGGNKSGIPTTFGQVLFHEGYMGKCLVFVTAVGIMPAEVSGKPAEQKRTAPGDLVIMCGGRVGKDGIHGVTASSEVFSAHTPAGHVQIGDPYTQKKMHDFLLEARDNGLIQFITDNGGGGLSSSIGESARFSNGCEIQLEKVPLKYEGLDQWEIWISESQERMTVAIKPENLEAFMALSQKHAVESTVIGKYTDTGKLHVTYDDKTCAYVELALLKSGFSQWEFEAQWQHPEIRGLYEPVLAEPRNYEQLLVDMLSRPNICSKEWIVRQYDHEVQGTSVIKPLIGADRDVVGDAAVIRPVLDSPRCLAFAQSLIPEYSLIDAYHMTACVIDEAVRRVIAVGGNPDHIGGVDNFCWPNIQYDPEKNPDGKFKAAQLVRSCRALQEMCLAYRMPLLSGKDSMYVDGHLPGKYGETHKISALETLQFSTISVMDDVSKCITPDAKIPGDLVYVLGMTRNELGASEYYRHFGYTGINVPKVQPKTFRLVYRALYNAINKEIIASAHGVYRGGLAVHLAMVAMAGCSSSRSQAPAWERDSMLGMSVDLNRVPVEQVTRNDAILFSESAGRFVVTVAPEHQKPFEEIFKELPFACIGTITEKPDFEIKGIRGDILVNAPMWELKEAWKKPFGGLI